MDEVAEEQEGIKGIYGIDNGSESSDDSDDDSYENQVIDGGVPTTDDEKDPIDADEDASAEEEAPEEAPIKRPRNPAEPTFEEKERHWASGHLPYRPWCPVCVSARAREDPHYQQTKEEKKDGIPTISMDYATVGERDDKEDLRKLLVGRDRWTKMVFLCIVINIWVYDKYSAPFKVVKF